MRILSQNVYSDQSVLLGNTFDRTPGFYGHLPKFWRPEGKHLPIRSYNGYVVFVFPRRGRWVFNYWGRNPYTHRIFERHPNYQRKFKKPDVQWEQS